MIEIAWFICNGVGLEVVTTEYPTHPGIYFNLSRILGCVRVLITLARRKTPSVKRALQDTSTSYLVLDVKVAKAHR